MLNSFLGILKQTVSLDENCKAKIAKLKNDKAAKEKEMKGQSDAKIKDSCLHCDVKHCLDMPTVGSPYICATLDI